MNQPLIPRKIILSLAVAAVILPITLSVVGGVAVLLSQMGDQSGGMVLGRISLGLGILWSINLVCLLLAMAIGRDGG